MMEVAMRWEDLAWTIDPGRTNRVRYAPHGETDFIDLPAPVETVHAGPFGVVMQCADHGVYWLTGDPDTPSLTWRVQLLIKA